MLDICKTSIPTNPTLSAGSKVLLLHSSFHLDRVQVIRAPWKPTSLWSVPRAFINWSWLCISFLEPMSYSFSASDKLLNFFNKSLHGEKKICMLYSELINTFVLILVLTINMLYILMYVQHILMYAQIPKK